MRSLERVNIRTNVRTYVRTYVLTYIRTGQTLYPLHNFVVRGDKKKSRLGTASNKITGGLELVCGRPTLALASALVHQIQKP